MVDPSSWPYTQLEGPKLLKEPFDISDSVASRPRDVSAGRVRGPAAAGPRHGHRHRQVHHPRVLDLGTKLVNA